MKSKDLSSLRSKLKEYKTSKITVEEGVTDISDLARGARRIGDGRASGKPDRYFGFGIL